MGKNILCNVLGRDPRSVRQDSHFNFYIHFKGEWMYGKVYITFLGEIVSPRAFSQTKSDMPKPSMLLYPQMCEVRLFHLFHSATGCNNSGICEKSAKSPQLLHLNIPKLWVGAWAPHFLSVIMRQNSHYGFFMSSLSDNKRTERNV